MDYAKQHINTHFCALVSIYSSRTVCILNLINQGHSSHVVIKEDVTQLYNLF